MIKRLRLKGFRRYADATFELAGGVTFIDGRNNAGKTTLFLAIEYALTGTVVGARSQAMLLHPGAKGLGVELVFTGKDGQTYKLQRLHQLPPRAKSRLIGHFTLKQLVGPDDERYVLSSDFGDHEDVLAKKLAEITGISRRVLDLAVHVRQGEIARILDGDPKLDIVLGVTAAATANEEMRSLALADEDAAEELPAIEASLDHLERQRSAASADAGALEAKLAQQRAEATRLATAREAYSDDDDDGDGELARFGDAFDGWREAAAELARLRERDPGDPGGPGALAAERSALEAKLAEAAAQGDETERRYDLRARIRRRGEAAGKPSCEHCGGPIDPSRAASELAEWQRELAALEAGAIDTAAVTEQLREVARREADHVAATQAIARAAEAVARTEVVARELAPGDARPLDVIEDERRAAAEAQKIARAAEQARNAALLEAVIVAIAELEAQIAVQSARGSELDREHARVAGQVERLRGRKRRAEDLRRLAAAFKDLQEQLRTKAAAELAASTYAIHRALSVEHEIAEVTIDPARYQVLVTPRSTGQEMPASLAQGGGHRLLLGLAFRLALVQRLGPFPFVLLDEPTYGLDERHRHALLERIAQLELCDQILVITHQSMGKEPAQRISVGEVAA